MNELLNELNAILRDKKININEPDTRQYILGLIEQLQNEAIEE